MKKLIILFLCLSFILNFFFWTKTLGDTPPDFCEKADPEKTVVPDGTGFVSGIKAKCYCFGQCDICDVGKVISNIFIFIRKLASYVVVLMVIWGALVLIFAGGSPKQIQSGQKIILSAIIGLLIVFGVSLIINSLLILLTGQGYSVNNIWNGINCLKINL